jgi:hypothetical protein
MQRFERAARADGVSRVWFLARREATRFYERMGYSVGPEALPEALDAYVRRVKSAYPMWKEVTATAVQAGADEEAENHRK